MIGLKIQLLASKLATIRFLGLHPQKSKRRGFVTNDHYSGKKRETLGGRGVLAIGKQGSDSRGSEQQKRKLKGGILATNSYPGE